MHPRLFRLIEKHQRIDRLLESELRRPGRDSFRVMRLKRLKLRVKDLIHRFTMRSGRRARHAMP